MPGEKEFLEKAERSRNGIPLSQAVYQELNNLSAKHALPVDARSACHTLRSLVEVGFWPVRVGINKDALHMGVFVDDLHTVLPAISADLHAAIW